MLVQHHSQRIHHVAATYPSTAEPRKYLPQSRKTSVIVPIRRLTPDILVELVEATRWVDHGRERNAVINNILEKHPISPGSQ